MRVIEKAEISDETKDTDVSEWTSEAGGNDDRSRRWQMQKRRVKQSRESNCESTDKISGDAYEKQSHICLSNARDCTTKKH